MYRSSSLIKELIKAFILFLICGTLSETAIAQSFDPEFETARIMEIHNRQRDMHFNEDIEMASQMTEGFISVNKGEIKSPTYEENKIRWQKYFNTVEFIKWDDIVPPIINFSDDGTMAYTVVNKEVVVKYKDDSNKYVEETTIFAWVAIYKKDTTGWKIVCVSSTNQPPIIK